jgi:hypothetical protein
MLRIESERQGLVWTDWAVFSSGSRIRLLMARVVASFMGYLFLKLMISGEGKS